MSLIKLEISIPDTDAAKNSLLEYVEKLLKADEIRLRNEKLREKKSKEAKEATEEFPSEYGEVASASDLSSDIPSGEQKPDDSEPEKKGRGRPKGSINKSNSES